MIVATANISGFFDPNIDTELYPMLVATTAYQNMWFYAPTGAAGSTAQNAPAYSIGGMSTKYEVKSSITSANSITAEVQTSATGGGVDHGYLLSPYGTQSAAGNSSSYNNTAGATTNGGVLIVHCYSDVSSLVVTLQDSADNSTFANVTGYSVSPTNSTINSYRYPAAGVTPSGTIRQYTRVTWTGTGTFLAMFSRK